MELEQVHFQGQITDVKTNKDKGLRLVFHTQELKPEEKAIIFDLHDKHSHICVAPNPIDDLPVAPKPDPTTQSASKKLRTAIWVYFREVHNGKQEDFERFYNDEMQLLINQFYDFARSKNERGFR